VPEVKLRVAGTTISADGPFVNRLRDRLAECGLAGDAEFLPNITLAQKQEFLRMVTVLSVPALYGESFGLYVLEALAAGVPVVQPRHAAFPELMEATGGGVLWEPDKAETLSAALENLLLDPDHVRSLGERGRRAVIERFGVDRMAREVAGVCEAVLEHSGRVTLLETRNDGS
jgi:glycosyltransferase involved in cell wall biosynthesis